MTLHTTRTITLRYWKQHFLSFEHIYNCIFILYFFLNHNKINIVWHNFYYHLFCSRSKKKKQLNFIYNIYTQMYNQNVICDIQCWMYTIDKLLIQNQANLTRLYKSSSKCTNICFEMNSRDDVAWCSLGHYQSLMKETF